MDKSVEDLNSSKVMKENLWDITDLPDLEKAAKEIIEDLENGEKATVIALHGDLGAGKTTFTQILASLLGVDETVTSPTFVIMKNYQTDNDRWSLLTHIDAYRLDDSEELAVLGFARQLEQANTLICIEWAERVNDLLPEHTINLHFAWIGDKRTLRMVE